MNDRIEIKLSTYVNPFTRLQRWRASVAINDETVYMSSDTSLETALEYATEEARYRARFMRLATGER